MMTGALPARRVLPRGHRNGAVRAHDAGTGFAVGRAAADLTDQVDGLALVTAGGSHVWSSSFPSGM